MGRRVVLLRFPHPIGSRRPFLDSRSASITDRWSVIRGPVELPRRDSIDRNVSVLSMPWRNDPMGPPERRRPPGASSGSGSGGRGKGKRGNTRRPKTVEGEASSPPMRRIEPVETEVRIVGGEFRGRRIRYSGDPRTRPMKNATREAIFNLVGAWIPGRLVIDLFAGTGAVGIEGLSRGAVSAQFVERHHPTARIIKDNLETLGLADRGRVDSADGFFWMRERLDQPIEDPAWVVFFCPPYDLFRTRGAELQELIGRTMDRAPSGSVLLVEAPETVHPSWFPNTQQWRFRPYEPALIGVWRPDAEPATLHERFDEQDGDGESPDGLSRDDRDLVDPDDHRSDVGA